MCVLLSSLQLLLAEISFLDTHPKPAGVSLVKLSACKPYIKARSQQVRFKILTLLLSQYAFCMHCCSVTHHRAFLLSWLLLVMILYSVDYQPIL
jgi:hypothetical protein